MTTGPQETAPGRTNAPVIATFHSLTGGVGGTMAVVNCAALLAAAGRRVLVIDWDLAAPRVHAYLRPFLDETAEGGGLIGLTRRYGETRSDEEAPAAPFDPARQITRLHTGELELPGQLDYLPPTDPAELLRRFTFGRGWDERPAGVDVGEFAAALRRSLAATPYDYVLVDAPDGNSDAAHAATERLPDVLVLGCLPVADSVARTAALARRINELSPTVRILPVLMRVGQSAVDTAEYKRVLAQTAEQFGRSRPGSPDYWERMRVPESPDPRRDAELTVLTARPAADTGLAAAYGRLVAEITRNRVRADVPIKRATVEAYQRMLGRAPERVSVCVLADPRDRAWADWVRFELVKAGVEVCDPPGPGGTVTADRLIAVGTSRPDAGEPPWAGLEVPPECEVMALRTSRHAAVEGLSVTREIRMDWRDEESAREALLQPFAAAAADTRRDLATGFTPKFPRRSIDVRYLPPPNPAFVGRQRELDELRDKLQRTAGPYVLHGEAGTGKSQIALEYAHRFAADYDQVWWIPAQSDQEARAVLSRLARQSLDGQAGRRGAASLGQASYIGGDLVATALDLLGDPDNGTWLLVFDNVDVSTDISALRPRQGGHGHVIVTARGLGSAAAPAEEPVEDAPAGPPAATAEPGSFSRAESVELLRREVPALPAESADRLADLVGDLPLAVSLVAAWIAADQRRRLGGPDPAEASAPVPVADEAPPESVRGRTATGKSVEAFLEAFAERRRIEAETRRGVAPPAAAVLDLSLETLLVGRHGRALRRLVEVLAFLSPEGVSRPLLYSAAMLDALRAADDSFTDSTVLDALLVRAQRLGFLVVDHDRDGQILTHRLVQRLVQDNLGPAERAERRAETLRILAAYCPPDGEVDQPYHREALAELQRHLPHTGDWDTEEGAWNSADERVRRWLVVQVRFLRLAGDRGSAREGRRIAETLLARWPADDPMTVRVRIDFAHLIRFDDPRRAAELFTSALGRQRRSLGIHHPATLMTARGRGAVLRLEGAFNEAYDNDVATWRQIRRVFGADHPLTATATGNLVLSEILVGHYEDALDRELNMQDRLVRVSGDREVRVLASRIVAGILLRELGRYEESEAVLQSTLTTLEDIYPENALNRLSAQRELALARLLRPDPATASAGQLIRRIVPVYARTYGESHAHTLACRIAEGIWARRSGDDAGAAEIMERCRDRYREVYRADDHPFALLAQGNLALCVLADRPGEALELGREAMEGLAARLDVDHPYVLLAQLNHGTLLGGSDDPRDLDEAVELLEQAHAGYTALLGHGHPAVAVAAENLGAVRARRPGPAAREPGRLIEWTAPLI
ncbi:FxSxx-COOH system tetratricopeptide repeat protein [Actinomadura chibensis]|uniref:FxSxx-COOH system tetratricopeptide repeat protein n=1 Tax=Actinomadura chibensis TaxID=392828 RepID=UPI000AB8962B|nr:FxSxx-COOH system tetratricopeptide repeat protein [Actinomadura chibensis]